MPKKSVVAYDEKSHEIARMFTRAIDMVFSSERVHSKDIGEVSVGRRQQEATAQAVLDYILRQGDEAEHFARALKIRGGSWTIEKEVSFTEDNRVDHVLFQDEVPTIYIEDKVWAHFGPDQLLRYRDDLVDHSPDGVLVVLVPEHRQDEALRETSSNHLAAITRVITWRQLPELIAKFSEKLHLWHALSTFAEETGSSNLIEVAGSGSFPQSREIAEHISLFLASADEISDLFHKASKDARGQRVGPIRFQFSHNATNARPWLQSGATGDENWGLEIDPGFEQRSGIWLFYRKPETYLELKIGYYRNALSQKAKERIDEIARRCVKEEADLELADGDYPRLGSYLTADEQKALNVLLHVFDVRTAKNYLPPNTYFRGVNDETYRHGMRFSLGDQSVEVFLGPPLDTTWKRPSVFIRSYDNEYEIDPRSSRTGKDYVLRAWQEIADYLLP